MLWSDRELSAWVEELPRGAALHPVDTDFLTDIVLELLDLRDRVRIQDFELEVAAEECAGYVIELRTRLGPEDEIEPVVWSRSTWGYTVPPEFESQLKLLRHSNRYLGPSARR